MRAAFSPPPADASSALPQSWPQRGAKPSSTTTSSTAASSAAPACQHLLHNTNNNIAAGPPPLALPQPQRSSSACIFNFSIPVEARLTAAKARPARPRRHF
mmetsp:Transcript_61749/g.135046  ORF Transcript_61749/g.135046 Transcript_61749/m.135046 type:complete len:101 (-) Transcript_61749:355-657(-)